MPADGVSTRRRRLGKFLRDKREEAGKSVEDARLRLRCSQPKINRMENGRVPVRLSDLEILLLYYGVSDQDREAALSLWEDTQYPSLRLNYVNALIPQFRGFARLEAEASEILTLEQTLVPGLLQTPEYARALHHAAPEFCPAEMVDHYVAARLARQKLLTRANAPTLLAVIDEAAVRREVGGREVMRDQLGHLIKLMDQPKITIRVLRFGAGAYGTMGGAVTVLSFPDPEDPPNAYLEYQSGGMWAEDPADVARFRRTIASAAAAALDEQDTRLFLASVQAELDAT